MIAALAIGGNSGGLQRGIELVARELPAALQRLHEDLRAAPKHLLIQVKFPVAAGMAGNVSWCRQGQQPVHVCCRHKMQRAAHGPGAHDGARGDGLLHIAIGAARQTQTQ